MVLIRKRTSIVAILVLALSASAALTACASQQAADEPEALAVTEETDATSASTDTGEW